MTTSEPVTGRARVMDRNGLAVRTWKFSAVAAGDWVWDGKDEKGKTVADGAYTFRLDGVDPGGNGTVQQMPVLVDRTIGSLTWATASFRQSAPDQPESHSRFDPELPLPPVRDPPEDDPRPADLG